ncbi:MAG TPA: GGDEF domain-containing protein [Polyangiales bacterium]|nr:GGDEF domain-containing protein [Polyangiales bacterium]
MRVAFAVAAVAFADSVAPDDSVVLAVSILYLALSLGFQWVIRQGYGHGQLRSLGMGLVDIAFLSHPVYLLGPASSVIPFAYLLVPVVNAAASSTRSRVAMMLAGTGSFTYVTLLTLVWLHWIPNAPARHIGAPTGPELLASGTLVVMSVLLTTLIVLQQMNALDRMNRQLSELSQLDELTGLFNRRQLFAELHRQLDRVNRGASCGVLMIDLDGFKRVNDQLGHDAGDQLLRDIAGALTVETRTVDVVARYGGDEFVVVLPDLAPEGALPVAERVVTAIAKVGRSRWPSTPVTASVGVGICRPGDDVASILRRADTQAYVAKRAGGDRVALADVLESGELDAAALVG